MTQSEMNSLFFTFSLYYFNLSFKALKKKLFLNIQLASAPAGLSITEMEIRQFQALYPDSVQQRMFCYFRDPNVSK